MNTTSAERERSALPRPQGIRLSGIYFVTFLAYSAILPYIALYYSSIGFSGLQIGALLGLGQILSLVATPFWTGVADASKRHHLVLVGGILVLLAGYAVIPILGSFTQVLVAVVLIALLSSQVISLQDSATMHMLGARRDLYGRLRLWGTVGWGIGAPLFGQLFDKYGLVWMFWSYSILMAVSLLLVNKLEFDQTKQAASVFSGLRELTRSSTWRLFLLISFLAALGMAAHNSYLSLLVQDLGAAGQTVFGLLIPATTIVGIVLLISTICEIPVMFFSNSLLLRFGDRGLLLASLAVISLRNMLYVISTNALHVFAVQVLHGFTFAALWVAGVNFVAQNAPTGLNATAQGLFNTVLIGFGFAAGNLLSGVLIDLIGVKAMFAATSVLVLSGLIVVVGLNRRFRIFK